jgi:hypothetical protein
MYEDIWSKGNFPKEWSSATIIPILKPGKNPTNAECYRPISLTSCLCKVLKTIVNKRLEERKLLYGFRKNRSTTDVLTILENTINWKIDRKLLHFINEFMKNRTLRVAIGSTLSKEKQIVHTNHKHERVSVVKLQKAMDKIVR